MKLRYYLPRPDLRDLVRAYYVYEAPSGACSPLCAEIANVRFTLAGGGTLSPPDGRRLPFAPAMLLGPTMAAYAMQAERGTRVFGAGILPRGWAQMFGVGASEIADHSEDLGGVVGAAADRAAEIMRSAEDDAALIAAADAFFGALALRGARRAERRFPAALQAWLIDSGELRLDRLIERMDVSRRQTDRLAKEYFGASPKLLQRKYRTLRAADRILIDGARDWLASAGEAFYDQSHFIKEFKTFIGATPAQYLRDRAGLVARARADRLDRALRHPLAQL